MKLPEKGIDIFYVDESHDNKIYVVTAVAIPFMRELDGEWTILWDRYFNRTKNWRKIIKQDLDVPVTKELHGLKLASGRGNFNRGQFNFSRPKARGVYSSILAGLSYLPPDSVLSACCPKGTSLYGENRLDGAMLALFQRMRIKCHREKKAALVFFDQGHPEYRKLYRKSQIYLPTGSQAGGARNLPLEMFFEDGNEKNSKHCWFTQIADLLAYSAFLKIKGERDEMTDWQGRYNWGAAYDEAPHRIYNRKVSRRGDGIVMLS